MKIKMKTQISGIIKRLVSCILLMLFLQIKFHKFKYFLIFQLKGYLIEKSKLLKNLAHLEV